MKTSYTSQQLSKLNSILEQRGVTPDQFQLVLGSGLLSDIFDPRAKISNRIAVRQALELGALPSEPGRHIVNFGLNLADMISAGNYDWKNENITEDKFPVKGEGQVEFEDTIFHFDRSISSEDAVTQIIAADPENPWEPAKIENLLAYGAKNPEEQRKFPIVGLGSVGKVSGGRDVPYLYGVDSKRSLYLLSWNGDWDGRYRFLAVRKFKPSGN